MQLALGVVYAVALCERVERIALTRMQAARERERVEHLTAVADLMREVLDPLQLVVDELDVEIGVVNDQLGPAHEFYELGGDVGEAGLSREEIVLDAVHLQGAYVDGAFRIDVTMEAVLGRDDG